MKTYVLQANIWRGNAADGTRLNAVQAGAVLGAPVSLAVPGIGPDERIENVTWSASYGLCDIPRLLRLAVAVDPQDPQRVSVAAQYLNDATILVTIDILVFCP